MIGTTPLHVRFTGYFERQQDAHCGLHALNNALGQRLFTIHDMATACREYVKQQRREGIPDHIRNHANAYGWYSADVMAFALTSLFTDVTFANQGRLNLDVTNPVQPEHANRIYDPNVAGIVVNLAGTHWVAFRYVDTHIWLLDSRYEPRHCTFDEFTAFLVQYYDPSVSTAFAIC